MIFIFVLIFILINPSPAGSIKGKVNDAITLLPLEGVQVSLHVLIPDSALYGNMTGVNGNYKFTGIIPKKDIYLLIASKTGYKNNYTRVDKMGSQDLSYDIYLVPDTVDQILGNNDSSFIGGYILEPLSDGLYQPVENSEITFYSEGVTLITSSDNEGYYKVKVPVGLYTIKVSASGFNELITTNLPVEAIGLTYNAVLYRIALSVNNSDGIFPYSFVLFDAFPNPFNPATKIEYQLPIECIVKLSIFNLLGQKIETLVDGVEPAGFNHIIWNANRVNTGVYYYRIEAIPLNNASHAFSQVKRLIYIK